MTRDFTSTPPAHRQNTTSTTSPARFKKHFILGVLFPLVRTAVSGKIRLYHFKRVSEFYFFLTRRRKLTEQKIVGSLRLFTLLSRVEMRLLQQIADFRFADDRGTLLVTISSPLKTCI